MPPAMIFLADLLQRGKADGIRLRLPICKIALQILEARLRPHFLDCSLIAIHKDQRLLLLLRRSLGRRGMREGFIRQVTAVADADHRHQALRQLGQGDELRHTHHG